MGRYSKQNELIINSFKNRRDHPTAETLHSDLKSLVPKIGIATVYRNLVKASQNGEALRISVPGGADRFDSCTARHINLYCAECGRILDLFPTESEWTGIMGLLGGASLSQIVIHGVCKECREKKGEAVK
ncbi:MAG: transcriptional repressor [Synergistaceae bacterium]|jgi:Fur family peroxide stress response transcriptional regulator|nr:transcriptional repressor [Synergistaceae bacterium]